MILVNGKRQKDIAIADRALQYGDGCFTTIAYRNHHIELLDAHIQRLKVACNRLSIDSVQWSSLVDTILQSVEDIQQDCVIKVLISRGQGGRGYSPDGCNNPIYVVSHHVMPSHYENWQNTGIDVTISPIRIAKQPLLAGIKHLNRLEQVLIKQSLLDSRYPDALVCDTDHNIIETSIANLFWKANDTWYTPSLDESGVEGVMRNTILAMLSAHQIKVQLTRQSIAQLGQVQEMFACNSLMKIVSLNGVYSDVDDRKITVLENTQTHTFQLWLNQQLQKQDT